jgi:hypothetical protein
LWLVRGVQVGKGSASPTVGRLGSEGPQSSEKASLMAGAGRVRARARVADRVRRSKESVMRWAAERSSPSVSRCGVATVNRPAARAAANPCGESSTATEAQGSAPRRWQANR